MNPELQHSVKEIRDTAEELKGLEEDLKPDTSSGGFDMVKWRTKETTENLHKHIDGVWTEAEAKAKKE